MVFRSQISSQLPGDVRQPDASSHEGSQHWSAGPGSQSGGVSPTQLPAPSQMSEVVHWLPSSQPVASE